MAEETTKPDARKKGSPLMLMLLIGGILVGEAVLIIGAMYFVGGPSRVQADQALGQLEAESEKLVEVLVLDDRLPNTRSGLAYLYDTEIWVQIRRRHEPRISDELQRFRNEIKSDLAAIWRSSEPRHFQEPRMENLTRKVQALLDARFGSDPETGDPIIEKVVIVSGPGFRIDH